jgi:hypothetical protein
LDPEIHKTLPGGFRGLFSDRVVWLWILVPFIFRMLLIGRFDLGNDEAHYYMYAAHPDFSFFDHPMMIGVLIRGAMSVFGQNEFAVRFFAPVCFLISSILFVLIAESVTKDRRIIRLSIILLNVIPLFGILGSTLMIPDDPLSVFWLLYLYIAITFFPRLAVTLRQPDSSWSIRKPSILTNWLILGLLFGLGLLSKYNAVLLPAITFLILFLEPSLRKSLRTQGPWISLFLGLLVSWPIFYWNSVHGGASFLFQLTHGLGHSGFDYVRYYQMIFGQAGYLSPILWVLLMLSLVFLYRKIKHAPESVDRIKWRIVFLFSLVPILFFNAIGILHPILPHWPALGYLVAILALSFWRYNGGSPRMISWLRAGMVLGAFLTLLAPLQVVFALIPLPKEAPDIRLTFHPLAISTSWKPVPPWVDITNDLFGFRRLANHLGDLLGPGGDRNMIFISKRFNTADELAFYENAPDRTLCLSPNPNQFDFWNPPQKFIGMDAIYVATDKYPRDPRTYFPPGTFESITKLPSFRIYRNGHLARIFYIYRMRKFLKNPWPYKQ